MMREKRVSRCRGFLRLFALLLLLCGGCVVRGGLAAPVTVEAASESTVRFSDGSGSYLVQRGSAWYLRDQGKKALSGLQYLNIPRTGKLHTGFYMFDGKGRLIQKKTVYYFRKQTVAGVTFNGYYCTASTGNFPEGKDGIYTFSGVRCNGRTFTGYHYYSGYGKLSSSTHLRRLKNIKALGGRVSFNGLYYFDKYGKLCTSKHFHTLRQTLDGEKFNGKYYFGGANGRLVTKSGWVTYRKEKYYVNSKGRMVTDRWKSGYYLQSDGTIAKNKKLPDGTYVDYEGRKCSGADAALSSLGKTLRSMVNGYSGTWSIYVKDLKTGGVIRINDRSMSPASTIKAFVMAATYDRIRQKKLSYSSTVRTLLTNMITVSDNESYNELVRRNSPSGGFVSGASAINSFLRKNGYTHTEVHHTLHPSSSASAGDGSNFTTAADCGRLLEDIYNGTCVSKAYSKEMMGLLCRQTRRWKIPSGIPSGVRVGNKTGENDSVQNDIAVVFGPKTDYVICVFSATGNEYYSCTRIRDISSRVYKYLN